MSAALDRLVSEKVMGWTVRESDPDDNDYERYSSGWAVSRWNPSTDIAAAWEVVEHLRKQIKDDGTRKYLVSIIEHVGHVEVQIESMCMEDYYGCDVPHGQEPRGICIAALRAVGVPESEIQEAMR